MLDPGSQSQGGNLLYLKEGIRVSTNSFKSFAVREIMGLLASKKHPGRPLKQAEKQARCRIWMKERKGRLRRKVQMMDGLPGTSAPSGPSLQLTLRLLLQGRPVALGPGVLCRSLSAGPYLLDVNILEGCR